MTYRDRLHHWIVVRLLLEMQRAVVGRFYRRSDAEGHLRYLRLRDRDAEYVVMFDCPLVESEKRVGDRQDCL